MARRKNRAQAELSAQRAAAPEPILSLDTLTARRTVLVDGEPYELRYPTELSLIDHHRIGRQAGKVDRILSQEELTDEDAEQLSLTLDALCRFLLLAPDEIQEKLNDSHRMRVMTSFTELQREAGGVPAEAMEGHPPPTGESTSPG